MAKRKAKREAKPAIFVGIISSDVDEARARAREEYGVGIEVGRYAVSGGYIFQAEFYLAPAEGREAETMDRRRIAYGLGDTVLEALVAVEEDHLRKAQT